MSEGEESFEVLVYTPAGLERQVASGPLLGRHIVVAPSLDVDGVVDFLRSNVETITGETWREVTERLRQIGAWEFEGYRP